MTYRLKIIFLGLLFTAILAASLTSQALGDAPSTIPDEIRSMGFEAGKSPDFEIHVSPTGSDLSGDGSSGAPYATIARAVEDAGPGAAIRIHPGTYAGGISINQLSGTAEAPIWIGGANSETRPIIDGGGEGLHLTRVSYLILHDLEVRNSINNGINTDDGGLVDDPTATHHIIFRNLNIHDIGGSGNQDCLKLSGVNDFWVLDSEFSKCGGGISGSGIDHVGCHRGLIRGNFLHDLSGSGIQTKGGSEDIEIHRNWFTDAGQRAVNIGGSTGFAYFRPPLSTTSPNFEARNIRVIANVFEGSVTPLAFVGTVDSLALNNTIILPETWLLRILQETVTSGDYVFLACGNNTVINNIFYFDTRNIASSYINIGPDTDAGSFTFANNFWYAHNEPGQSQPNWPVPESNPITGLDPLFAYPVNGDYHLPPGSPAIGNGITHSQTGLDYDGLPFLSPPSRGAYEFWESLHQLFVPFIMRP